MNLEKLIQSLKFYIDKHPNLTKTELAERIGVSRSELVQWLDKDYGKKPTADKAFKIQNYLQKEHTMQHNDLSISDSGECLDEINAAVIKRYAAKNMSIKHAQSAFSNPGYVAAEGGSEQALADNVSQFIKEGRIQEAQDLLNQIQRSGNAVQQATVNRGSTRSPLVITSNGERKQIVGTQSFESADNRINFSKATIEACKNDLKAAGVKAIAKSHKLPTEVELTAKNGTFVKLSQKDLDNAYRWHADSIVADEATCKSNLAAIEEREARSMRLSQGKGNLDDLRSAYNRFKA